MHIFFFSFNFFKKKIFFMYLWIFLFAFSAIEMTFRYLLLKSRMSFDSQICNTSFFVFI